MGVDELKEGFMRLMALMITLNIFAGSAIFWIYVAIELFKK
jgi:hypothetical protein